MARIDTSIDMAGPLPREYDFAVSFPGLVSEPSDRPRTEGRISLLHEENFWCDHSRISGAFCQALKPRLMDFINIAAAVYAADRMAPRSRRKGDVYRAVWQRIIRLEVPVQDADFWRSQEVADGLSQAVMFVADDACWEFHFSPAKRLGERDPQQLELWPKVGQACLYSAGLDSVAGLVHRVVEHPDQPVVAVSARTQSQQQPHIDNTLDTIGKLSGVSLHSVVVPASLRKPPREQEPSQRARSFLLLVLGAVSASLSQSETLEVFENGIEALNLPLNEGLAGGQTPRPMHPVFLHMLEDIVSRVLERPFRFMLPRVFDTKTQMVSTLAGQGLGDLACVTTSCAHYRQGDCGLCTGCILRRMAMALAGLTDFDVPPRHSYKIDLMARSPDGWHAHGLAPLLKSHLLQAWRLRNRLAGGQAWEELVTMDWNVCRAAEMRAERTGENEQHVQQSIVQMYRRYAEDWHTFAQRARDDFGKTDPTDWPSLLLGDHGNS